MMQILDIALYGDGERIRRVRLHPGGLNIVTGASKTGKSALAHIIEYCLGRRECLVPVGAITQTVRWYGLRLQFPHTQVFVARRAPQRGFRSNTDVYVQVGDDLAALPSARALVQNSTPDEFAAYLTRLLGVAPNLHIPPEGQTRPTLEATVRHALFYCFQQQSEIDSPQFMFHRQGEDRVPQAIKDTLPYFLGAVHEDRLAKIHELREARRNLDRIARRRKERELVGGEGLMKGLVLRSEAVELGLLPFSTELPTDSGALRRELNAVLDWTPQALPITPGDALSQLQEERAHLRTEYRHLSDRLHAAEACAEGQRGFEFEAQQQRSRLEAVGLFDQHEAREQVCPLCDTRLEQMLPAVADIRNSVERISRQIAAVATEKPRLDEFIDQVRAELRDVGARLSDNREAMRALTAQSPDIEELNVANAACAKVVGRISLYLESVQPTEASTADDERTADLEARIAALARELDESSEEELLPSILNVLGQRLAQAATELGLEYATSPLRLDLSRLTVVADTDQGPVALERMGSAANWVGYHLAVHSILHQWFIQKARPVPGFVVFDQPTQAFFPRDEEPDPSFYDLDEDDRESVKRMFAWLADRADELHPGLQIIVTDHADIAEDWFQRAVVERWRQGVKLIPADWLGA